VPFEDIDKPIEVLCSTAMATARTSQRDEDAQTFTRKPCHRAAISHIRAQALVLQPDAIANLTHILRMSNIATKPDAAAATIRATVQLIAKHARIALHFHPDRPVHNPSLTKPIPESLKGTSPLPAEYLTTVARSLLHDGVYKSQFQTLISNGAVSAHPGGARDEWERALFDGAYHRNHSEVEVLPSDRPRYGALDLFRPDDGPAPRFGSCYFLLKPEVGRRATVTYGGSQDLPKWRGCLDPEMVEEGALDAILWQVMEESFIRDSVLGVSDIRPSRLLERLQQLQEPLRVGNGGDPLRNLDHLIEVQIHGEIRLGRDVEMLVVDPSFVSDTVTGRDLEAMAKRYRFPLRRHAGSVMLPAQVPSDFRGPTMPSLAQRIAVKGLLNAGVIGAAVQDLAADPMKWADRGTYAEVLQELKLLWHVLVRYGGTMMWGAA
jgi:hypothetical protein